MYRDTELYMYLARQAFCMTPYRSSVGKLASRLATRISWRVDSEAAIDDT